MEAIGEILVVPFFGQGHLFPTIELCKHLSLRHYKTTLIIPTHLSSSIPSSFRHHLLTEIAELPSPPPPEKPEENGPEHDHIPGKGPFDHHHQQMSVGIESFLATRSDKRPTFVILDVMMNWSREVFNEFDIPAFIFMTSGACSSAMEYARWKEHGKDMKPGEIRYLPGLPEDMPLIYADVEEEKSFGRHEGKGGPPKRDDKNGGPPNEKTLGPHKRRGHGPPGPGDKPRWLDEVDGSLGLFINTSDDLERPFLNYITNVIEKPVWGVGPMLPEPYWKSAGSLIHDHEIRTNHKSNYTEDEVMQWLERKSDESVIYISFGSEVGPTTEEYIELEKALEESNHPFIWVVRPGSGKHGPPRSLFEAQPDPELPEQEEGYFPHALASKVGDRGLVIHGWAPQLLILSHKSTGGFLSHCGWNSTVEAMGRGIPLLAWPIRGDQFFNAKLVVSHLKVGRIIPAFEESFSVKVKKDDIAAGIETLMADEEVRKQALILSRKFESGFPESSEAALDAFVDFIGKNVK